MRFTSAIVSALAAAASAAPAGDVISNFNNLNALTVALQSTVEDLNQVNIFTNIPSIINGYREIITTTTTYVQGQQGGDSYPDPDATNIVAAYNTYVTSSRAVFSALIGKSSLVGLTPFSAPIAAVLRANEGAQDAYAFGVADGLEASQATFQGLKTQFDETEAEAIEAYSGAL